MEGVDLIASQIPDKFIRCIMELSIVSLKAFTVELITSSMAFCFSIAAATGEISEGLLMGIPFSYGI